MKSLLTIASTAFLAFAGSSSAQLSNVSGGFLLGGGYLEDPGQAYGFGQLRGTFYEDDSFSHTVFLEVLGYVDDADVIFNNAFGGTFSQDGDITFVNVTLNYELEAKLFGPISVYGGGGVGAEFVNVDSGFISLDSDANFIGQFALGLRADFGNGISGQAGVRYLIRDDFELLNDQFITEDTWAYEIGLSFSW